MIKQSCNLIGWKRLIGPKLKYSITVNHNDFHFKISQVKITKKKIRNYFEVNMGTFHYWTNSVQNALEVQQFVSV